MEIIGCQPVLVARLRLKIDWMSPGSGPVELRENLPNGKRLQVWVPKKVAKHLVEGDEIEVLCAVSSDLLLGHETFVLAKKEGNITRTIYATSSIWNDMFSGLMR